MGQVRASAPEIVIGLVAGVGVDLRLVAAAIRDSLQCVGYESETIRLSQAMRSLSLAPWCNLRKQPDLPYDEYLHAYMDAGDQLRLKFGPAAMAWLAMIAIRQTRKQKTKESARTASRFAYVLHSLKHPGEINVLRQVYGAQFVLIAAHAPRSHRRSYLAAQISKTRHSNKADEFSPQVEALIRKDEAEADDHGQNVRGAFPLADVVVDARSPDKLKRSVDRSLGIVFGNPYATPTRDEQGMFLAYAAACRSASMARQVGAALCRADGSVIAVGTNEVAKRGGGQYWQDDEPDGRDFKRGEDSSESMRRNVLGDVLERLNNAGLLSRKYESVGSLATQLTDGVSRGDGKSDPPIMRGAVFNQTIDFVRAVHAEMAAITAAAAHGVSTCGATLYTSTFPCHDCAKHVIAAGVGRVVYLEPYAKSLVEEMFGDSVRVDPDGEHSHARFEPFVGVAPRRYMEWFSLGERNRKQTDGSVVVWDRGQASPLMLTDRKSPTEQLVAEITEISKLESALKAAGKREEKK